MITLTNISEISEHCLQLIKNLQINLKNKYNLYSDEGGMIGNPTFFISDKVNEKIPYSTYHGKMNIFTIKNYIIGRLCTWQIGNNQDYSNVYKIIKL